ncbi:glutaredoxin family protein [[Mycobacterium] burgundiense]|uniref:Glutaredoxin family protein n=1 Tax=[Mycobacterium] burgundiense TaxID=3064286 RepID=A0ABM9M257_9MYCO|nr:glutaredoxin family protein [Mycolicibacterium sp. MU0053]CAJ1508847.1 glutaredoxin family protein [Mycolicibacterium sp. MU0053]
MSAAQVCLLVRSGCQICGRLGDQLTALAGELDFELSVVDVDEAARAGDAELRAEYGDRLPVVLLDGTEHSYWEIDEPRLRRDLAARGDVR